MDALTVAGLIALGMKFLDCIKFLRVRDWNAAITQASAWIVGVALVWLAGAANVASGITLYGSTLQDMNGASKVLVGLGLLSIGSLVFDAKKAVDSSDTASTPALVSDASADGFK